MKLREFYLETYSDDELGLDINGESTFEGLLKVLSKDGNLYEYIGVSDSLIRERLFERLANEIGVDYDWVYNLWVG